MQDPAISTTQPAGTYPPWDDGVNMDIFIKNASGKILVGEVSHIFSFFLTSPIMTTMTMKTTTTMRMMSPLLIPHLENSFCRLKRSTKDSKL
jgi:hypothetical protein